jgi:hypothetical protein
LRHDRRSNISLAWTSHMAAWIRLHDIDTKPGPGLSSSFHNFRQYSKSDAAPLYYAGVMPRCADSAIS